jgi:putative hydrolase of the HAD superfamily
MPIRALFFDLDDTLLETHQAHQKSIRVSCEHAARCYPGWTPEQLRDAFFRAYRIVEEQMEMGRLTFDSQLLFRTRVWEDALEACRLDSALGRELAEVYLAERRRNYRLYDEVPELLDRLKPDFRLVLVTNGLPDLQREKIDAVGLERWFPHAAISGELRSWKPDPGIFRHALGLAGTVPAETVMLGDSLERDIAGAGALGIRTVWVRRYEHQRPIEGIDPDHEMTDLLALPQLLAQGR